MNLRLLTRKVLRIQGASWQHPLIRVALQVLDPIDAAVRIPKGLRSLPRYSARVRSNGLSNQFGGTRFDREGKGILQLLKEHCDLHAKSRILEIGCGCGRTAVQLVDILEPGQYVGMDIEKVSVDACTSNQRLTSMGFRFDLIDIHNSEYNPTGRFSASEYRFSYPDSSINIVYLMSVFTHMLPRDLTNYVAEIGRMVGNGGACLFSTFLTDYGRGGSGICFGHDGDGFSYYDAKMPEVAVAYRLHFFEECFGKAGFSLDRVLLGNWRQDGRSSETALAQDVLVFKKAP